MTVIEYERKGYQTCQVLCNYTDLRQSSVFPNYTEEQNSKSL